MSGNQPPSVGIFESLRRVCTAGLGLLQNRVELFAVELQQQKEQVVRLLVLAAAAILFANTALLVVTAAIVFLVGESARTAALIALAVIYVLAALGAFLMLRKELRSAPPPFNGTVSELRKDREWLTARK
jgi:uncharacterized membrane protein YqjE